MIVVDWTVSRRSSGSDRIGISLSYKKVANLLWATSAIVVTGWFPSL